MTRDDIIRIYSQVSDELCGGTEWCWHGVGEPLQRFAELVAAAERKACARLCEQPITEIQITDDCSETIYKDYKDCAEAIRARRKV